MQHYDAAQQQALKVIRGEAIQASSLFDAALAHSGEWVALPLADAIKVRKGLKKALEEHSALVDAATAAAEALADKVWNALTYSEASIVIEGEESRAHRGRAFSSKNQLVGLVSRIDAAFSAHATPGEEA